MHPLTDDTGLNDQARDERYRRREGLY